MGKIKWPKVEPSNGGLISAAATVSDGYRQFMLDSLTAKVALAKHFMWCWRCKPEKENYCNTAQDLVKQITERLSEYKTFFEVCDNFQKMHETFGPIVEEGEDDLFLGESKEEK